MADFLFLEEISEMMAGTPRPPLLFKKSMGAKGFFRPYMSLSDYTDAEFLSDPEHVTPVIVKLSAMLGDEGTPDTVRNIKGMTVRFKTIDGIFDLMSISIPVFFTDDYMRLGEICRIFRKKKLFDGINPYKFWRYVVDNPNSLNCALRLYSTEGLRASYTNFCWYSVFPQLWNTYRRRYVVKYVWEPIEAPGEHNIKRGENISRIYAEFQAGFNPDIAYDELGERIDSGRFPTFELQAYIEEYEKASENILRSTVSYNDKKAEKMSLGVLKLTEMGTNVDNEVRCTAFAIGNTVKGISLIKGSLPEYINYICRMSAIIRGIEYDGN